MYLQRFDLALFISIGIRGLISITGYAIIELPIYQLAKGLGSKCKREGVLNDMTTLPNTTPPGR